MSLYIDIHALQTLPPSNINRDDTGSPKTATFGGVVRQRVSSQAWKHAIRHDLKNRLTVDEMGIRTKRVVQKIGAVVKELDASWEMPEAEKKAEELLKTAGFKIDAPKKKKDSTDESVAESGYLLFLSNRQITNAAQTIISGAKISKKEAKEIFDQEHSVDLALFGRMVADDAAYNVDASVQVAHAIGVSGAEPEFDFFTAVDDAVQEAEETGAGMMGTVEMMSSTLYRFATVNFDSLSSNLGEVEAAIKASVEFVDAFITSMPTGKQNTFANRTLPEAVVVAVRTDRPVSWVNAFETPVAQNAENGRRVQAAHQMAEEALAVDEMYDSKPESAWVLTLPTLKKELDSLGEVVNRSELLNNLRTTLEGLSAKDDH